MKLKISTPVVLGSLGLLTAASVIACSADPTDVGLGTGGVSTGGVSTGGVSTGGVSTGGFSTGGVNTGGTTGGFSTGGVSTGGFSTGGVSTGGTSSTGGSLSTGGVSTGGTSSTGGSSGGKSGGAAGGGTTSTGGSSGGGKSGGAGGGGTTATGGSTVGGGSTVAVPSAGCSKAAGRPAGGKVTVANDHIYDFPASYDGTKPFPLLIGFHAAGNPIDQIEKLTNGSAFETNFVRAFPKSAGNEWVYNTDLSSKVYKIYDELMANYCIDTSRVFATGHSSGAQMIVQILTKSDASQHMKFKAVAPVAASNYGAIVSPIPVMYIQGKMDSVRNSDGADVVARFTAVNKCTTTTMPYTAAMTCSSGGTSVNPGCVSYQGCMQPTIWCSHNDPAYSGTSHGVPCFAVKSMYDFFTGLP